MKAALFRRRGRRSALAAIAAVLTIAAASAAQGAEVPWSFFALEAARFGSTATVEVALQALPAAAEAPKFIDSARGRPLHAWGAEVQKLSVTTTVDILGGRRVRFENHLWLDPLTGTPLYLIRTRFGLKDYHQRFRFTREGVFRQQREPASGKEAEKPPDAWTRIGQNFYPYPPERQGCSPVIETSMLIAHIGGMSPATWDAIESLCVFHKRQVHQVSVRREPVQRISFDYLERKDGREARRTGSAEAAAASIASVPIGSYRGEVEEFFRDGSRLCVSPADHAPLMVSGELPVIGRVELRLREIHLK
jgi:hypothetical protein